MNLVPLCILSLRMNVSDNFVNVCQVWKFLRKMAFFGKINVSHQDNVIAHMNDKLQFKFLRDAF